MGKSYSVNGYINATLRRTARTFLVEGVSDKSAIHRLAAELNPLLNSCVVIDHAGMIDDPETVGFGNKSKVLMVKNKAKDLTAALPKISTVLATLVDREWDELSFEGKPPIAGWTAPNQEGSNYVTLGHSIENYFFETDCIIAFLKTYYAEHITAELIKAIQERFCEFLALAASVSFCAKESGCIKKLGGFFHAQLIEFKDGAYYLTDEFDKSADARKIADATAIRVKINDFVENFRDEVAAQPNVKWILHGHIGSEVIWACVSHAATSSFPASLADEIVKSHKSERTRFSQDWLSKAHLTNRFPLDQALAWLGAERI